MQVTLHHIVIWCNVTWLCRSWTWYKSHYITLSCDVMWLVCVLDIIQVTLRHIVKICGVILLRKSISWTKYESLDITLSIHSIMSNVAFVTNLLNVLLAWLVNASLNIFLLIQWSHLLPISPHTSSLTFVFILLLLLFWSYSVLRHNLYHYHVFSVCFGRHCLALCNGKITKVLSVYSFCWAVSSAL